jgi:hypothetical protein
MSKDQPVLSRRAVVGSAGTAGALAAAAAMLPAVKPQPEGPPPGLRADVDQGGYQETPHVLHYYRTARV